MTMRHRIGAYVMNTTKIIDRELVEDELEHVSGGFTSTEHGGGSPAGGHYHIPHALGGKGPPATQM
jgi:hypothetical protein